VKIKLFTETPNTPPDSPSPTVGNAKEQAEASKTVSKPEPKPSVPPASKELDQLRKLMEDNLKEQKTLQDMVQQESVQRTKLVGHIEGLSKQVTSTLEDKKLLEGKLDSIQQEVSRIQRLEENLVALSNDKRALEEKCKKMEEELKHKRPLEQQQQISTVAQTALSSSSSSSQMSMVSAPKHLLSPELADMMRRLEREAQQKMMLQEYLRELEAELERVRHQLPKNKLKPLLYFQAAMWILLIIFLFTLVIKKYHSSHLHPYSYV